MQKYVNPTEFNGWSIVSWVIFVETLCIVLKHNAESSSEVIMRILAPKMAKNWFIWAHNRKFVVYLNVVLCGNRRVSIVWYFSKKLL